MNTPQIGQKFRHFERNSVYEVVAVAIFTCKDEAWDDEEIVVYKSDAGYFGARPLSEFCDGRFEAVP